MFIRLLILSLLTLAFVRPTFAQQEPAPAYPPGTYQPQQYPQQDPNAYPQQPMQPEPYPPGGYPSPLAADPNAPYPPGGYPPGYVYGAQPPQEPLVSSVEGALQLSLGTYFVRYTSSSTDYDNETFSDESVSELLWGLSEASTITIEGGYGVMDRLLIGGVLQLGGTSRTSDPEAEGFPDQESSTFDLLIGPKAEFHFLPTSKFNPYAGAVLAIASHSDEAFDVSTSRLTFNLQIRGGVRCFITDSLSIDPSLVFAFGFGGGSIDAPPPMAGAGRLESDLSVSGFRIGLALSVSGWLR